MELFELFIKGGYVMYPLLLCSFIAVIICVERLRFYRSMLDDVNALRETIIPLVQQSNWKGLQALKETSKGMATHVIAEAARGGNNKEQQEKLLEAAAISESAKLRQYLNDNKFKFKVTLENKNRDDLEWVIGSFTKAVLTNQFRLDGELLKDYKITLE